MKYDIYKIDYKYGCCVIETSIDRDNLFPDPVDNPLLLAHIISGGMEIVELNDEIKKYEHGDNPTHIWDLRDSCRPCSRVFAWVDPATGAARYLGAREAS